MPKVTVLLFSYNHEKFIRSCIDSVLAQTFTDYELIVIDDCSPDSTWDIVQSYRDPRIQTIRTPQNLAAEWMYDGIDRFGTGEYIAVQNSDDVWMPEKLEAQVNYLQENAECGAVFTGVQVIDEKGLPYKTENRFYSDVFGKENKTRAQWLHDFFYQGNSLCASSVMIRRSLFQKANLKSKGIYSIPDYLQWVKVCGASAIHIIPKELSCYRVRDAEKNISSDTPEGHIRFAFENFILLQEYLKLDDETFREVFPTAKQYVKGEIFNKEYAYARILIEESRRAEFNFLGLLLLYRLFNKDESYRELQNVYGFSHADFVKLTGKLDVFGVIPRERYQSSTLLYRSGDHYSDENRLTQTCYILGDNTFELNFELPRGTQAAALRFGPDKGCFRRYSGLKILVDGREYPATPLYLAEQKGAAIDFYTTDPQLEIVFPEKTTVQNVKISGSTVLLPAHQVEGNLSAVHREKAKTEQKLATVSAKKDEMEINLAAARREQCEEHQRHMALLSQYEACRNELAAYKNEFEAQRQYLAQHRIKAALKSLLGRLWQE